MQRLIIALHHVYTQSVFRHLLAPSQRQRRGMLPITPSKNHILTHSLIRH